MKILKHLFGAFLLGVVIMLAVCKYEANRAAVAEREFQKSVANDKILTEQEVAALLATPEGQALNRAADASLAAVRTAEAQRGNFVMLGWCVTLCLVPAMGVLLLWLAFQHVLKTIVRIVRHGN